jgi:hypothetical protein
MVGAYGMLPGDGIDLSTMGATTRQVYAAWHLDNNYGWDFALLAMNAARLGDPNSAVNWLTDSRYQFSGTTGLPLSGISGVPSPYFPSAGGLLYAAAMMAAGWDGAPDGNAPGFPSDEGWSVRAEGLSSAI